MSKWTAPGICPSRNSTAPEAARVGQVPRAVDHAEVGVAELGGELGGRAEVARSHGLRSRQSGASAMRTRRLILPFFSIWVTDGAADLAGPRHMRAAARLEIEVLDRDEPDAAGSCRRLDRHRLDQRRVRLELLVGDPALRHRRVARDELVEPALHLRLVEGRLAVEVEPSLALADRAAGDGVGQHDRKEMQRRMGAHALVAPAPVDPGEDASRRRRAARRLPPATCKIVFRSAS